MRRDLAILLGVAVVAAGGAAAWRLSVPVYTEAEQATIASLSLAKLPPLKPDPSNRHAADPAAAALGATLFFETRLSVDGIVSCATCHRPEQQFQDGLPLGRGIGVTDRRTMPLAGVASSPWQFWDGRADSLWAQALGPLEDSREHGGNRTAYAHFIAEAFGARYERIFGELPDMAGLPRDAGPLGTEAQTAAWEAMSEKERDGVNRVFANIGKAIAAFEASLAFPETRFDRFAKALEENRRPEGDADLSELETEGLKLFIGKANCVDCHNGPRFTDDHFHNTGVPTAAGLPEDRGRAEAVEKVLADPFNCLGVYSDAGEGDCGDLRFMLREGEELVRAFKTPSLRGAASRPPYMHSGQIATLEDAIDHYDRAPDAPAGHSELQALDLTDREKAALAAFLKTLEP